MARSGSGASRTRHDAVQERRAPLERRLLLNASLAGAVTGALVALACCVFATFIGFPPSPWVLVGVVLGSAIVLACAAATVIARTPPLRRALGLDERRADRG